MYRYQHTSKENMFRKYQEEKTLAFRLQISILMARIYTGSFHGLEWRIMLYMLFDLLDLFLRFLTRKELNFTISTPLGIQLEMLKT